MKRDNEDDGSEFYIFYSDSPAPKPVAEVAQPTTSNRTPFKLAAAALSLGALGYLAYKTQDKETQGLCAIAAGGVLLLFGLNN